MNKIEITGNIPLNGEVCIQGSKNAALPLMAGAILHEGTTVLHNCPRIRDIEYMAEILRELGCLVTWEARHTLKIDAAGLNNCCVSARYATRLRASVILMGSLLGRCKKARLPYPGGCVIGTRPIDLHIAAMQELGAAAESFADAVQFQADDLHGCEIALPLPSVGATENVILAAALAKGTTRLCGCAAEPEVEELCRFLNGKGARISGVGSTQLCITGVDKLKDSEYTLITDRIVAGTYLCAAAGTRGSVTLLHAPVGHLKPLTGLLEETGAKIFCEAGKVTIDGSSAYGALPGIRTAPYPGFPTDLQSQMMAVLCCAQGRSTITENLFEARFLAAGELNHMGAHIRVSGRTAYIEGVRVLDGGTVKAQELRGGAALVIAGLMARGRTQVCGCSYIERGYEDICRDLRALGADIRRDDG